jgi:tetratricopeptide (TPR) repeat protein
MRMLCGRCALCLALASVFAFGWTAARLWGETAPTPAKEPARPAAKDSASSAKTPEDAAKINKQLAAVQEQITALSNEESQTLIKILTSKKAAMDSGKIEDTNKVRDDIAKGKIKADWRDYRQVLTASGQMWEALAQKFARLSTQMKPLERDRDKASPDAQAQIDAGDCYYDAADFKKALPIFAGLYQEIPEDKRAAEKALTEKLADVCYASGDLKTAFKIYEGQYNAAPPAEQKNWSTQKARERMANIYEKNGDYKAALPYYKSMLETYTPDKRTTDETKWLRDKIAACEAKANQNSGTPTGSKGAPAPKKPGH